jgi:(E)-4-hydroxy-3-methyl-but-2-enyl pyrophosphate reductase
MKVIVAKTAGVCFGVKRALEMVENALQDQTTPVYCLGPLIHNPKAVEELENKGLKVADNIAAIDGGRVVIRSHGAGPQVYREAAAKNLVVIDATCPDVKKLQQLAVMLHTEGYQVIVFGEHHHAEVRGVLESVAGAALAVSSVTELGGERIAPKVGLISQTTQEIDRFQELAAWLVAQTKECRVFNTICRATSQRQREAAELSGQVDLMIVVGGKNSANTTRLAEICRSKGTSTHQVETPEELDPAWFAGVETVGVTAGASTPEIQITKVLERINQLGGNSQ